MTDAAPDTGQFITFEGGEGSGKSTQCRILAERLRGCGIDVVTTREPGGSPGAEIIRHVLLSGLGKSIGSEAEALLFAAARDDHVTRLIAPALERGQWVLCDRFVDSTRVYQGEVGGVDRRLLDAMQRATIGDLAPDLTLILDVPAEVGLQRAAARRADAKADRFESETLAFHQKLRDAFCAIAAREPKRCVLIDATRSEIDVAAEIHAAVAAELGASFQTAAVPA